MKKKYEVPKAEKLIFDFETNVVASGNAKDGRDPSHPSYNSCFTHNAADVSDRTKGCEGIAKP